MAPPTARTHNSTSQITLVALMTNTPILATVDMTNSCRSPMVYSRKRPPMARTKENLILALTRNSSIRSVTNCSKTRQSDSNHVATIETLGEMSIRSGQYDKAKKRYQKLLSLQPENQGYKAQLEMICAELGDSDCL